MNRAFNVPSLFDQQEAEKQRVSGVIAITVLRFLRKKFHAGHTEFHADELREFVREHLPIPNAPGSADRILRDLRKKGAVAYTVVDRRASLYRVEFVR
jgi:hypothetical protein